MAVPANFPKTLYIYRGDTYLKSWAFTQGVTFDPAGNPLTTTPLNLTLYGNQWTAQLRSNANSTTSIPFTVDISNAANGVLVVRLEADVTATIPGKGTWDIQVIDTTQTPHYVRTILRGVFERVDDVTRP